MTDTPNPIQVQKFLGGIDYPATRDELVAKAKDSGADADVVKALEGLPESDYDSPTAVSSAISNTA